MLIGYADLIEGEAGATFYRRQSKGGDGVMSLGPVLSAPGLHDLFVSDQFESKAREVGPVRGKFSPDLAADVGFRFSELAVLARVHQRFVDYARRGFDDDRLLNRFGHLFSP